MSQKYHIQLIKIETELERCSERVKNRDGSHPIPLSIDKIEEYNGITAQVFYDWDLIIGNNHLASEEEIIDAIQKIGL